MSKVGKGISLQLPEAAYVDLELIIKYSSNLNEIENYISAAKSTNNLSKLVTIVSQKTTIEEEVLSKIISALLQFHKVRRDIKKKIRLSHDEFIILLGNGFIEYCEAEKIKNAQEMWDKARTEIGKVLSPNSPFFVLEKSIVLAFAHQNVMSDIQLITDIRPVFNDEVTKVKNMVITHLLMLEYYDGESQKKLHLAIDALDIKNLIELCERAQKKISLLSDSLKNSDWAVSIIGGEDDDCE